LQTVLALALAAASIGSSVQGTPLRAVSRGSGDRTVLVVGDIHGNERAGRAVIKQLRHMDPPDGVRVVTAYTANPDGERANTRQNAHGVDLNRNWPRRWRGGGHPFDTYYPGARKGSEPETRAMMRLIRRERPDVTIWLHQHLAMVVDIPHADHGIIRRYARAVGLPAGHLPNYHGTATGWQNHALPDSTAFVVELPAGALSRTDARRHARAALATVAPAASTAAKRPHIVQSPIPFGRKRKREMKHYSHRHYGPYAYKLTDVRTIVEHYTAVDSYSATWNTFANDSPDPELHELPGTCAHFVIDSDGTIHQLVSLKIRCRHTVGLNDRSIGIEHVATSDAGVMDNRRMLRASLRLTRWLQDRYDVPTKYVIGHAESLSSPFHHERVARLRTQTHGDMQPATMKRYRHRL
jgi:N-acetylmuramoyl-L-alanine amidase